MDQQVRELLFKGQAAVQAPEPGQCLRKWKAASKTGKDLEFNSSVHRNLSVAELYEHALQSNPQSIVAKNGALVTYSARTGRSPADKRVVATEGDNDVWRKGSSPNHPYTPEEFKTVRQIASKFLAKADNLYVQDGFVNWANESRMKVRMISYRPAHALFMHNMMIRPTEAELAQFGTPDLVILNAGEAKVTGVKGNLTGASVAFDLEAREMVIVGTEYAGEMKKGVFTFMHYLLPQRNILSLHSGANMGVNGDVTLFLGLSGTGKTTLSADPERTLIGDDELGWGERGVFNIEGGCYAKCAGLSAAAEPQIFNAIKYGALIENVPVDSWTREVDYNDLSITDNTRVSYPIEHIANAQLPAKAGHAKNIVFLTCDAFGVLPPVARLTPEQAMYHFISGYTAKVAGTEVGVKEPIATFSACYGGAFLVLHPMRYAAMLAERMQQHGTKAWLVNTGWTGGAYGEGKRMDLAWTRAILKSIHDGSLDSAQYTVQPIFGFQVPSKVEGLPSVTLDPRSTWKDKGSFDLRLTTLAKAFMENMRQFCGSSYVSPALERSILEAGPQGVKPIRSESDGFTLPTKGLPTIAPSPTTEVAVSHRTQCSAPCRMM